jgi:copper chaperone CopZ
MATIEFDAPTVHCVSCKLNIEDSLGDLAGVGTVEVDVEGKRIRIDFDAAIVDPVAISTAIEGAGYPVS